MHYKIRFLTCLLIANIGLFAQQKTNDSKPNDLIQFSGVIVEADSLRAIPYTSILVKNNNRGTISDYFGYFSFVAQKSDTIEFTAIGYRSAQYVIPDSLVSNTYSLIQVLQQDTIFLKTTEIYPWPSKEQFKHAFLNLDVTNYNLDNATSNNRTAINNQMVGMAVDASLSYKYVSQQNQTKLYSSGQYPSYNILNPVAWAKFIKAWKNGSLKK